MGRILPISIGVLLAVSAAFAYYALASWGAAPYQQMNAAWTIQGVCRNAETRAPIGNATVTATFREPITREAPPLPPTTTFVLHTDSKGQFEVSGRGGSVCVTASAEGYDDLEPWDNWCREAIHGFKQMKAGITFDLKKGRIPGQLNRS